MLSRIRRYLGRARQAREAASRVAEVLDCAVPSGAVGREELAATLHALVELRFDRHDIDVIARYLPIQGRVLDVGCGACWHAPFLLARGATAYTGVDVAADPTTRIAKNTRLGVSLEQYLACFPNVHLERTDVCDLAGDVRFDNILLLTVSEHLLDPAASFEKVAALLERGGRVLIVHHNFYAWNGHHCAPSSVAELDAGNPAMRQLGDWGHVLNKDLIDLERLQLNAIRFHELIEVLERFFRVERVDKYRSQPEVGGGRLTPEIRRNLFAYYDDELTVELFAILCRSRDTRVREAHETGSSFPIEITERSTRQMHCYVVPIPLDVTSGEFELYEDDTRLGPSDALHVDIRELGGGRYSIWTPSLYLSTSDNSDPVTNGRRYTLRRVRQSTARPT